MFHLFLYPNHILLDLVLDVDILDAVLLIFVEPQSGNLDFFSGQILAELVKGNKLFIISHHRNVVISTQIIFEIDFCFGLCSHLIQQKLKMTGSSRVG